MAAQVTAGNRTSKNNMHVGEGFTLAIKGLRANKSRSALTILGIVIGIASIMLIMTVGKGAESSILEELSAFGAEMIVIRPGQQPTGPTDIAGTLFNDSLGIKDIEALKRKSNVPDLRIIAPVVIVPGSVSYKGETFKPVTMGWDAEVMAELFNFYPEVGLLFDEDDIKRKSPVALIGSKTKDELFGESDALGKNIKIKNKNFRVIGVFPKRGQLSFFNVDEIVLVPYSSAQSYLLGIDYFHEIIAMAESAELVDKTVRDIEFTLRELHGITNPEKDDFFIVTQEGMVEQVTTILQSLTIFLSAVVAIALVVGGIGVMNIMLVSITERTREIGLRKAVGARYRDILTQFLIEAVVLTFVGGIIGIIIGAVASFMIAIGIEKFFGLNWPFTFPWQAAIIATAVSTLVGLVFGIFPARLAAKKDPIEALRYE